MKFKAKSKDYYLNVKVKMSFGEKVNEKELDRFARLGLRGFMRPKSIKKNSVEYTGPIGQSLHERLKTPVSKREFLFIMEHIVVAIQKAQSNNLMVEGFVLDIQNVYINKITKEVQFIYLPLLKDSKYVNVFEFVETIIYSIIPENETTAECVSKFAYFMNASKCFNPEKVEEFITKEDRSVVNTIKKQNAGQSGYMTDKPLHYQEHYENRKDDDKDEATALLVEDEATALLIEDEATALLVEDEATALLVEDEATGLLVEDDNAENVSQSEKPVHYPSLLRLATEERISINKPVFRVGKESSYVDYFVSNNVNISRSHADIVTRGNKHFITDLNSKNRTYINGQMLSPHCETEIQDGDTIRLANEDFVFSK